MFKEINLSLFENIILEFSVLVPFQKTSPLLATDEPNFLDFQINFPVLPLIATT